MIGLVLCGGQSTRMGTDKGLMISPRKVTWTQQCFSLLAKLEIPIVLSVNQAQRNSYRRLFPLHELILDDSEMDINGPLLGLLSVHQNHPTKDIFVLACDMVEMNSVVISYLYNYFARLDKKETCVFIRRIMAEPLCAVYKAKDLQKIYKLQQRDLLEKQTLMYCLDQIKTTYLPLPVEWEKYFANFNTKESIRFSVNA